MKDEAAADTAAQNNVEDRVENSPGTKRGFGKASNVGVVVERHWGVPLFFQPGFQRKVFPALDLVGADNPPLPMVYWTAKVQRRWLWVAVCLRYRRDLFRFQLKFSVLSLRGVDENTTAVGDFRQAWAGNHLEFRAADFDAYKEFGHSELFADWELFF